MALKPQIYAEDIPSLSVIIPTLNEEASLKELLCDLKAQNGINLEIIVADGGSRDNTAQIALEFGASVVNSPKGRAIQMNRGAQNARYEHLFFLHADSRLRNPNLLQKAVQALQAEVTNNSSKNFAGHFSLQFIAESIKLSRAYSFYEAKTHLNRRNTTNGDQGLLITKSYYQSLGCFKRNNAVLRGSGSEQENQRKRQLDHAFRKPADFG